MRILIDVCYCHFATLYNPLSSWLPQSANYKGLVLLTCFIEKERVLIFFHILWGPCFVQEERVHAFDVFHLDLCSLGNPYKPFKTAFTTIWLFVIISRGGKITLLMEALLMAELKQNDERHQLHHGPQRRPNWLLNLCLCTTQQFVFCRV